MKERFSRRMGLQPIAAEIAIRYDAPEEFRRYLFFAMQKNEFGLKKTREIKTQNDSQSRIFYETECIKCM